MYVARPLDKQERRGDAGVAAPFSDAFEQLQGLADLGHGKRDVLVEGVPTARM